MGYTGGVSSILFAALGVACVGVVLAGVAGILVGVGVGGTDFGCGLRGAGVGESGDFKEVGLAIELPGVNGEPGVIGFLTLTMVPSGFLTLTILYSTGGAGLLIAGIVCISVTVIV